MYGRMRLWLEKEKDHYFIKQEEKVGVSVINAYAEGR